MAFHSVQELPSTPPSAHKSPPLLTPALSEKLASVPNPPEALSSDVSQRNVAHQTPRIVKAPDPKVLRELLGIGGFNGADSPAVRGTPHFAEPSHVSDSSQGSDLIVSRFPSDADCGLAHVGSPACPGGDELVQADSPSIYSTGMGVSVGSQISTFSVRPIVQLALHEAAPPMSAGPETSESSLQMHSGQFSRCVASLLQHAGYIHISPLMALSSTAHCLLLVAGHGGACD